MVTECAHLPLMTYGPSVQAEQKASSSVASHGVYVFKFNAENLIQPYDQTVSRIPELTTVSLSQEMHAALTAKTTAMIGGGSHSTLCTSLASLCNVSVHSFCPHQMFVRHVACLPVLTCVDCAAHCPD